MDLKQRLENQLDDAMLHAIILRTDIENIENGLIVKPCFSPICSVKTLKEIESAYHSLTIAIACALKEIRDKEQGKARN